MIDTVPPPRPADSRTGPHESPGPEKVKARPATRDEYGPERRGGTATPEGDDKLSWALYYAREMKIPVLPLYETAGEKCSCNDGGCTSQGKHPRTKNGLKDATRNEERIREWWTTWPNANIAGRMGKASGTLCLDCDTPETVAFVEQHAPDAPSQTTGSGMRQFFFLHEEGLKNWRGILRGMDVRTDNSYVVLPPSSNKNGPYAWDSRSESRLLPEEIRKVVLEHKKEQARIVSSTSKKIRDALEGASPSRDSVKAVLDTVRGRFSAEEFIPEGTRHDRLLEVGGSLRGRGVPEGKIVLALRWINENLCRPPLDDWDLAGIVDYVKKIKREVNDLVDDFEAWLETQPFKGKTGATDKKVVKTLLEESRKYGKRGLRGLDAVISRLDLKDKVGVGYKTVCASIKRIPFVESTRDRSSITNASTLTVLYPNGAEVNEDGELVVVPFVRQGDNSYIEKDKREEYREVDSDCPLGVRSRWGAGRLGLAKEDFLNLILENIGVGVPFTIGDLHFVNRDHNFKRRHLSDLAKPGWGFVRRVKRGVYVVPEDVVDIYRRYEEGSGEAEAEERELAKTIRRRLAFRYRLEVDGAISGGGDPKGVPVPQEVPEPEADRILEKAHDKLQKLRRRERIEEALRGELDWDELTRQELLEAWLTP